MRYDANGRPNPNGKYEIKNGNLTLRDGERLGFDVAFMDAASGSSAVFLTDAAIHLTDAERKFADSEEGKMLIAKAKSEHRTRNAWKGDKAPEFSDQLAAAAIRTTMVQRDSAQAFIDRYAAETDSLYH